MEPDEPLEFEADDTRVAPEAEPGPEVEPEDLEDLEDPEDPEDADEPEPDAEPTTRRRPSRSGSPRMTAILVAAIVLLVGLGGTEAWYLWGRDDPVVSSNRPVVTSPLAASSVVDTAARSAVEIVSVSYEAYDEQVERATSQMTTSFADEFRQTKTDIEEEFVADKTEVTAEVVEQGVVTASPEQVVALLFLTQSTTKDGEDLTVAQFRVTVTMVRTDSGWLVSDLQTQ